MAFIIRLLFIVCYVVKVHFAQNDISQPLRATTATTDEQSGTIAKPKVYAFNPYDSSNPYKDYSDIQRLLNENQSPDMGYQLNDRHDARSQSVSSYGLSDRDGNSPIHNDNSVPPQHHASQHNQNNAYNEDSTTHKSNQNLYISNIPSSMTQPQFGAILRQLKSIRNPSTDIQSFQVRHVSVNAGSRYSYAMVHLRNEEIAANVKAELTDTLGSIFPQINVLFAKPNKHFDGQTAASVQLYIKPVRPDDMLLESNVKNYLRTKNIFNKGEIVDVALKRYRQSGNHFYIITAVSAEAVNNAIEKLKTDTRFALKSIS